MTTLKHTEPLMTFKYGTIEVRLFWNGGEYCSYQFLINGFTEMSGDDFRPSPLHPIDSLDTIVALLDFITLRAGDVDPDYFNKHTPIHKEWLDSQECDTLRLLCYDFDNTEPSNKAYRAGAIETLQDHIEFYPDRLTDEA